MHLQHCSPRSACEISLLFHRCELDVWIKRRSTARSVFYRKDIVSAQLFCDSPGPFFGLERFRKYVAAPEPVGDDLPWLQILPLKASKPAFNLEGAVEGSVAAEEP